MISLLSVVMSSLHFFKYNYDMLKNRKENAGSMKQCLCCYAKETERNKGFSVKTNSEFLEH